MRRLLAATLVAVMLTAALPIMTSATAPGAAAAAHNGLKIAIIDTGIDATHQEFGPGQIVAWKDFTDVPSATPVDNHGHGTATASLAAGLNVGACGGGPDRQKKSFAPGADLIIGRVGDDNGDIEGDLDDAIDWAVSEGADVISVSIGSIAPLPVDGSQAFDRARAAGVLTVVAAGNGAGNLGLVPFPSWLAFYGNERANLVVGTATWQGSAPASISGNSDPDLVSWGVNQCVALTNTNSYEIGTGTSYAAPMVAGMALTVLGEARANGHDLAPAELERLISFSATNIPTVSYHREGLGYVLDNEFATMMAHAAAGTLPDYTAQGTHAEIDLAFHDFKEAWLQRITTSIPFLV